MATAEITDRSIYATYCNSSTVASTNTYYRGVGYSTSSGKYKYVTCYKFVLPSVNGTITAINLVPYIQNAFNGSGASNAITAGHTWKIGISENTTNSVYQNGTYSNYGTYTKSFSNPSNINGGDTATLSTVTFSVVSGHSFSSGQTLYIYVYSGAAEYNVAKITSLTGTVTYTPTTYYATKGTCTYANASVTPTSGTSGTSYTFKAWTNANNDSYIYGNLRWSYGAGSGGFTDPSYASGYGGTQSETKTGSFSKNFTYTATADRWNADPAPNDVTCTVSNVTSSSARVTVPSSGITTTFLNSYYYITATDSGNIASSLTGSTGFARSTGYVNLTGLASGTKHTRYVYAYNSYNARYYKISTVPITTSAANYTADITASVKGKSSVSLTISNLNSTTNLNSDWYLSTENSTTATSLSSPNSASRSSSITLLGLNSDTSYIYYTYVYNTVDKKYYQVGSISFTTDANYTGSLSANVTGTTTATISINNLNSEANLNNNIYITNNNVLPTTGIITSGSLYNGVNMTGFTENTSYTYDAYVYSSASGTYYKIGSVSFKTEPSSYTNIGKVAVTGITTSDAYMCCFGMKNNTNMSDSYIMTFDNCGDNISTVTNPIVAEDTIGQSYLYTDLIGGMPYTVYFYVKNTRTNTYRLVGSVDFNAYSSVFYLGEKRVRAVRCDENGVLHGCVIYLGDELINAPRGGVILNSSDSYELITSDGYRLIAH